jgi:hypothetical protein
MRLDAASGVGRALAADHQSRLGYIRHSRRQNAAPLLAVAIVLKPAAQEPGEKLRHWLPRHML